MRCDSIPYESLRNETNRIFIAFISESIEKFTALEILSGTLQFTCRLPARRGNTCAQTRTQMQTQTQTPTPTQAPTGSRQRVEAKRRTPLNLRLPTIHLVASAFLTQRFHFIFFGKFLACSARWHCMKFAQLPVGCSLFFSTFHIQLPLFFSVDCPPLPQLLHPLPLCHLLLLFLLSILLLFTLHWPLCCICFQFQLLRQCSTCFFLRQFQFQFQFSLSPSLTVSLVFNNCHVPYT